MQLSDHGYRLYIESLFDEIGREVRVLFDRRDPAGLLWPRRQALVDLFAILNAPELAEVWSQDETIGWVYQYFNGDEERRQMRAESQAPRNSRELAVRNQFFTPRYVVEFLTDNTLGRIWYEMRQGKTGLAEQCDYLVRRPVEVFLQVDHIDHFAQCHPGVRDAVNNGDFSQLPVEPGWEDLQALALGINGYEEASRLGFGECGDLANETLKRYREQGVWEGDAARLWCCLFFEQRRWRHFAEDPQSEALNELQALYAKLRDELQADTGELSQEELLRRPVFIPPRKKKDPRDIRILDPACGSGHFLLYAFDLLITMYAEAWEDHDSPRWETTGRTLREDHATIEELRLAIPDLILRHNLHGIDIDPRAAQIAALALWMRSQRAYNDFSISRSNRPRISKTNIVVAEPMPGEKDLLEEFVTSLDKRLGALVKRVFDKMDLAGEAGSLLKIQEEIHAAVREVYAGIGDLFQRTAEKGWRDAEEQLLEALRNYAEHARNGSAYRRRLFAGDAERGLGFIDLCRQKYDVVVMNPPFGDPSRRVYNYLELNDPVAKRDLLTAFIATGVGHLNSTGCLGAITKREPPYTASYEEWRRKYLFSHSRVCLAADLGGGVLDGAMVEVVAYVISKDAQRERILIASNDLSSFRERQPRRNVFIVPLAELEAFPRAPLAYDLPIWIRKTYRRLQPLEGSWGRTAQGLGTTDDFRFCRLWHEVPRSCIVGHGTAVSTDGISWVPYVKGEPTELFFADTPMVVNWTKVGREVKAYNQSRYGSASRNVKSEHLYGKIGIVFARRTSRFSPRLLPSNAIFSVAGQAVSCDPDKVFVLLGLLATETANTLIAPLLGRADMDPQFEVGAVACLPLPNHLNSNLGNMEQLVREVIGLCRDRERIREESTSFEHFPFLRTASTLEDSAMAWVNEEHQRQARLAELVLRIEHAARMAYQLNDEVGAVQRPSIRKHHLTGARYEVASRTLSLLLGFAFGRYESSTVSQNPKAANRGTWETLPSPLLGFLNASLGMESLVLVDDPGHRDDINDIMKGYARTLWRDRGEAILAEIAEVLGASADVSHVVRTRLFDLHVKQFSNMRRKAPIYWQLATPSASWTKPLRGGERPGTT